MTEPASTSSSSSSGAPALAEKRCDEAKEDEVAAKKPRLETCDRDDTDNKLEARLGGILCCAVCLDLPRSAVYQCSNGHLMCAGCFTHLLADARIRDETATCPNCRVEISRSLATRNLAVEKAVSELPAECQFCGQKYPRNSLDRHEVELCEERPVHCQYNVLGCGWRGPHHDVTSHEQQCQHPSHTGEQVFSHLQRQAETAEEASKTFNQIMSVLSFEKITFNDLQLKPYRTDEFIHKLFYETSRFSALGYQWVIKARLNDNQKDPHLTCNRFITYQLIVKNKPSSPMTVHFMILRGPFGDMRVDPHICQFEFTESGSESPFFALPLPDSAECNKLLAARIIDFRLMMGMVTK
ncbi:zinc finger TRAF-type-containing protein 1 homolog isoform X2 [Procambarus clarkii]|uniref:zinc finger TRAF-type-containing protein 1 homolog isoform X2 n=1 Tax=Procambarus clarkii TaxID=6728 RepID=UPI001E6764BA|nr:cysteine and histidine-rich protein 1 homolog isoform X2 [Procambarus clarkii]